MPRITSQQLAFAHSGLDDRIKMFRKNRNKYYPQMARRIDNKEAFYRLATYSDLPPAADINEATGVPYSDIRTPFFQDIVPVKRGMGFSCSREVLERDVYGILADRGIMLANSVEKAIDIDIAGFMIQATTGQIVTPDKVALASTAHLYQQGFYSNILSTNAPLSAAAIEQAIQEIQVQPSDTGDPMDFLGPFDLWVSPVQRGLADRLAGTTPNHRLPQSNFNDEDWGGRQIRKVVSNPYWNSNPFAWALRDTSQDRFFYVMNSDLFTPIPQYDIDKDVYKGTALAIWGKGVEDPRGWIYSAGS